MGFRYSGYLDSTDKVARHWHDTFLPLGKPTLSSAVPGSYGVCGLSLPRTGTIFVGGPRCGPLATPFRRAWLASGRLLRRRAGGRMFEVSVLHLLWADNSAGLAGHVKRRSRSPPRRDGIRGVRLRVVNLHSACSSALSGRRGSGEIRFMVGGGRPKADHVVFLTSLTHLRFDQHVMYCCFTFFLVGVQEFIILFVTNFQIFNRKPVIGIGGLPLQSKKQTALILTILNAMRIALLSL